MGYNNDQYTGQYNPIHSSINEGVEHCSSVPNDFTVFTVYHHMSIIITTRYPYCISNMGNPTINLPFGDCLYMFIQPVYGDLGNGLFLGFPHCVFHLLCGWLRTICFNRGLQKSPIKTKSFLTPCHHTSQNARLHWSHPVRSQPLSPPPSAYRTSASEGALGIPRCGAWAWLMGGAPKHQAEGW